MPTQVGLTSTTFSTTSRTPCARSRSQDLLGSVYVLSCTCLRISRILQRHRKRSYWSRATLSRACSLGRYLARRRKRRWLCSWLWVPWVTLLPSLSLPPASTKSSRKRVYLSPLATSSGLPTGRQESHLYQDLSSIWFLPYVSFFRQSRAENWYQLVSQLIVILGPPPAVAYPFILDVEGYPQQIINLFIVLVCDLFTSSS